MPYEIKWYQEPHIISVRVSGDVEAAEVKAIFNDLSEYAARGTHPVYVVSDLSELGRYPVSIAEYQKAVRAIEGNIDTNIIIGMSSPILKFLASILSQISHFELRPVGTWDEALALIQRMQPEMFPHPTPNS